MQSLIPWPSLLLLVIQLEESEQVLPRAEYHSATQKSKLLTHRERWMNLRSTVLSETRNRRLQGIVLFILKNSKISQTTGGKHQKAVD